MQEPFFTWTIWNSQTGPGRRSFRLVTGADNRPAPVDTQGTGNLMASLLRPDLAHARNRAARLLAYDNSPETKALLQQHANRAGQAGLLEGLPNP